MNLTIKDRPRHDIDTKLYLDYGAHGCVDVRAKGWGLVSFQQNGTIILRRDVPGDLGFQLDEAGRIKIADPEAE